MRVIRGTSLQSIPSEIFTELYRSHSAVYTMSVESDISLMLPTVVEENRVTLYTYAVQYPPKPTTMKLETQVTSQA